MLFDTHTHTNFDAFKDDYKEVIDRALGENIWLINVGSDLATSKRAVEIANEYKEPARLSHPPGWVVRTGSGGGVYAAVGLHPTESGEDFNEQKFLELAQNEKVVAIGETGLDYYRSQASEKLKVMSLRDISRREKSLKKIQKELFIKHIELAQKVGKPLIIHCRDAHEDLFNLLTANRSSLIASPGVMHFFTGTLEQARKYIDLGFYISFSGVVTFAKEYDIIVKEMPFDKILIETDAPYVSPTPMRGKRNEPLYVKYVAQKIAELRGISVEEVAKQTTENAKRLFKV